MNRTDLLLDLRNYVSNSDYNQFSYLSGSGSMCSISFMLFRRGATQDILVRLDDLSTSIEQDTTGARSVFLQDFTDSELIAIQYANDSFIRDELVNLVDHLISGKPIHEHPRFDFMKNNTTMSDVITLCQTPELYAN